MAKTLLIGHQGVTWREWLKEHRAGSDFVCLDPADPAQLVPGRLTHWRGNRLAGSRFYGSYDPQRSPHTLIAALMMALQANSEDLIVQLYPYRQAPLVRQVAHHIAEILQPDRILVAEGTPIEAGWPITPTDVELIPAHPHDIQLAQRKALWLQVFERCQNHEIDLRSVTIDGSRLGSGRPIPHEERVRCHLGSALHAEKIGNMLFAIVEDDLDEEEVSKALDLTSCSRATFVQSKAYQGLICSFARQNGEDFGYGAVQRIDWREMKAHILCDAIPPAPIRTLRLGGVKVGPDGDEWGEVRPWQV